MKNQSLICRLCGHRPFVELVVPGTKLTIAFQNFQLKENVLMANYLEVFNDDGDIWKKKNK